MSNNNFNLGSNQIIFLSGSRSPPNRAHSSPGWRGRAFPQTVRARLQDNLSHCQVISSINCYKTTKANNNNAGPVPWMMEQRRILISCKRFVIFLSSFAKVIDRELMLLLQSDNKDKKKIKISS